MEIYKDLKPLGVEKCEAAIPNIVSAEDIKLY